MKTKEKKIGLGFYLKQHTGAIVMYIVCHLVATLISVFATIYMAQAIEEITLFNYNKAIKMFFLLAMIFIVRRFLWYLTNIIYNKTSVKIMSGLNKDLSVQAFKLNSRTFITHDTGTFVQRIVQDPERVVNSLASMVDVITDILSSLIIIAYITTLNFYITLFILGIVIVSLILELFRVKCNRKNRLAVRKKNDKIVSLTTEIVRSEKDIKSLGLEGKLAQVSSDNYKDYRKEVYHQQSVDVNIWSTRNLIIEVTSMLLLVFGISIMDKGLITLASFMVLYSNHNMIRGFVWSIGYILNSIVDIKVSTSRMFALFDQEEFVVEDFGTKSVSNLTGEIEFKNVGFTFEEIEFVAHKGKKYKKPTKKVVSTNKIFENLSFTVPHNKTVAFVGKSGSGKSTILNLMAKMYKVEEGEVLVDGYNINDLDKETLRNTFSLVNQFPYIFDMTIKENLLLANPNATDEEIISAIRRASLEEFVNSLPKGLETKVGESGIKLSGGQKQRLAIARALLRKTPILLFDESTSSLDNFAQEEVKKSIDALKGTTTIVIVAHRLSTIKDADIIFFLDEGKIVAKGSFDELFSTNLKFKTMFLAENI